MGIAMRSTWPRTKSRCGVLLAILILLVVASGLKASEFEYSLEAVAIAEGVWMVPGGTGGFSRDTGGHMLNTGFVATADGAVVIDPGPTLRYGEALRALIDDHVPGGVARVYITHHHPDHVLGALAFNDVPIFALPATIAALEKEGQGLLDNFYRLLGDWMRGTTVHFPNEVAVAGDVTVGDRTLRILSMSGHAGDMADLAVLDMKTGTLFAGDIVFSKRAPTTPHADIALWLDSLDRIEALAPIRIVPGHGPMTSGMTAVEGTRDWLRWLDDALQDAASRGLSMGEALRLPIPARFKDWGQAEREVARSVNHLYPAYSDAALHWSTEAVNKPAP